MLETLIGGRLDNNLMERLEFTKMKYCLLIWKLSQVLLHVVLMKLNRLNHVICVYGN